MNRPKNQNIQRTKITIESTTTPPHESPPWSVATKSIVAVVSLLLITLVIWRFQSLIAPLVIALILAYLLNPVINFVQRRLTAKRGVAVLLVYLTLIVILVGGATALGIAVVEQAQRLSEILPGLVEQAPAFFQSLLAYLPTSPLQIGPSFTLDPTQFFSSLNWDSLAQQAASIMRSVFSSSGTLAGQLAQATLNVLTLGFLIFVVSIYISIDIPRLGSMISDVAQQPGYRQDAERLMKDFVQIWDAYLRGQVILGIVMGVVVGLVLAALDVSNALGLGLLSGVLEFLPVVGPLVGAAAAVLVAFFQDSNYLGLSSLNYALLILGVMILLQQIENNLLVPRIVGDALDLHALTVMISEIMGASLAGLLGAVLAAPVVASIKLIGSYAWRKLLDLPPFPEPPPPTVVTTKPPPLWVRARRWLPESNQKKKLK